MQLVNIYLHVKDAERAIEFYQKAFSFKPKVTMPGPDGKIMHAELTHGDCTVMLGPENLEMGAKAPSTVGGTPVTIYVYVKDVDALTRQARAAGGNVVREPADQFYGDRTAGIVDPEGHTWYFATLLRIVPPEEMHPPSA
jgi:PhnB protein